MDRVALEALGFKAWLQFSLIAEREVLKLLPQAPGVYAILLPENRPRLLGDSNIGYIGSAANQNGLRGRIRQYFHPGPTQSTNIAMKKRLSEPDCAFRIGFVMTAASADAKRLESDLLIQFESEHGELPPYNRQRALDRASRIATDKDPF